MVLLLLLLISCASIHCMEQKEEYDYIPLRQLESLQNLHNFISIPATLNDHENTSQAIPNTLTINNVWSTWAQLEATQKFDEHPQFKNQASEVIIEDIVTHHHDEIFGGYYYAWSPKHSGEACPMCPDDNYDNHVENTLITYINNHPDTTLDAKKEILKTVTQHQRIKEQIKLHNRAVCVTTGTYLCGVVEIFCVVGCCLGGCL
ncbi:MAG: hypothetical protein WCE21_01065 [Candidatus Babeliales bacterium]